MKSLGGAMRTIKKAGSMAPTVGAAKNILAVAGQLGAMFPKGSGGPATRSKPEIWTNMADFKAKLEGMKMAATALVAATGSGNLGTVKQAFGGVGQTCRGCHKPYRVPKKRH
ncbi:MAG: cytochrome c, partial [Rhodospirillales bacterium]|nr:cytochrome c [Rhodospirillales bacterium]